MTGNEQVSASATGNVVGRDLVLVVVNGQYVVRNGDEERQLALARAVHDFDGEIRSPALLVHPRFGVVPYVGAPHLAKRIDDWLSASHTLSVLIVGGQGGTGKTRLAVAACDRAQEAGWTAGFLWPDPNDRSLDALASLPVRRLIVVDYAETRLNDVARCVRHVQERRDVENPARLLLLMRSPAPGEAGEDRWLKLLRQHSTELALLAESTTVLDLTAGEVVASPTALFAQAYVEFSHRAGIDAERPLSIPADLTAATPLVAVLRAYLAVHGLKTRPDVGGLLDAMVDKEELYWRRQSEVAGLVMQTRLRRRIAALATLTTCGTLEHAMSVLRHLTELRDATNERLSAIAEWAHGLYPGGMYWNPLEPDLIGERLIAVTFGEEDELEQLVVAASSPRPVTVLARMDRSGFPVLDAVLNRNFPLLSRPELATLSLQLEHIQAPDSLARKFIAYPGEDDLDDNWRLSTIMGLETARPDTRMLAIAAELRRHGTGDGGNGWPWRRKDVDESEWRRHHWGRAINDCIRVDTAATVEALIDWLRDDRRGPALETDLSSVATVVLVNHPELVADRWDELLARSSEPGNALIGMVAERRADVVVQHLETLANSGDIRLQSGALAAARGLLRADSPSGQEAARQVLSTLVATDGPHRADAIWSALEAFPDLPGLADAAFEAAATRRLNLRALAPLRAKQPERLLDLVEAELSGSWAADARYLLREWAADSGPVEDRILRAVELARLSEEGELDVRYFCEAALYRLHEGASISSSRLDLIYDVVVQGPPRARKALFIALALPPGPPAFERERRRALQAISDRRGTDGLANRAAILNKLSHASASNSSFGSTGVNDVAWPSDEVLQLVLAGLDPVQVTWVVGRLLRANGGAEAGAIACQVALSSIPHGEQLDAFAESLRSSHDVVDAANASGLLLSTEPPPGG